MAVYCTLIMNQSNLKKVFASIKIRKGKTALPVSLRKRTGEILYQQAKLAGVTKPLQHEPRLREWEHWAIIDNAFPYDAVYKIHHMLIPKRVTTEAELTSSERQELQTILKSISSDYDCYTVNFQSKQSIRNHYHIHLMVHKDKRSELRF